MCIGLGAEGGFGPGLHRLSLWLALRFQNWVIIRKMGAARRLLLTQSGYSYFESQPDECRQYG